MKKWKKICGCIIGHVCGGRDQKGFLLRNHFHLYIISTCTCCSNFQSAEQVSTGPVKLTWRRARPAPQRMNGAAVVHRVRPALVEMSGATMVHGNTAYFSMGSRVYSYTLSQDKWTRLKQCKYRNFSMAVVNNQLTTIGGQRGYGGTATNTLLCLLRSSSEMKWEELFPPMPTSRRWSAAVTTPTHLIVAGGETKGREYKGRGGLFEDSFCALSVVEALNTNTRQWSSVSSSPKALRAPNMTLCNGQLYLSQDSKIFSCSVEELLKSHKPASTNSSGSVWIKLTDIPVRFYASLTTLRGQVLAIGGDHRYGGRPTGAIHQYNRSTNSWSVIGEMPTPRACPLVAVLPSHELIVVGGSGCAVTEIASSTY